MFSLIILSSYIISSVVISMLYFIIEEIYASETDYRFRLSPKELLQLFYFFPFKIFSSLYYMNLRNNLSFEDKKQITLHLDNIIKSSTHIKIFEHEFMYEKNNLYIVCSSNTYRQISYPAFINMYLKNKKKYNNYTDLKSMVEAEMIKIKEEDKIRNMSNEELKKVLKALESNK